MILNAKRVRCKQISYYKHNFSFLAYLQKAHDVDDRIESIKISYKRRKKTLVIIGAVISLSVVAIGIGFITTLASGYNTTNLYKQTLCTGKALDFGQKGVIRHVGGFNGAHL
jgi:hypothetical protein